MKLESLKKKLVGPLRILSLPTTICYNRYGKTYADDVHYITSFMSKVASKMGDEFDSILFNYKDYVEKQVLLQNSFSIEAGYTNSSYSQIKHIVESSEFQRENLYILSLSYIFSPYRYGLYRYVRNSVTRFLKPGDLCLEIGTGTGLDASFISLKGINIFSYDINVYSRLCLDILDTQGLVKFQSKFYNFDEEEHFNHCIMIELLEHLEEPLDYLIKANKILKKEGTATFTFALRMPQLDHLYLFESFEDAKKLVEKAGFEILDHNIFLSSFVDEKNEIADLKEKDDFNYAALYACNALKR